MIVVNFKTYLQATGDKAIRLAEICERVAKKTGVRIVACPQLGDMRACVAVGVECWAQHIDSIEPNRNTGFVTIEGVVAAGAKGSLLNHSEHKIPAGEITKVMERVKLHPDFKMAVCAANLEEAMQLSQLFPTYLAYEPPELVGSRDKSVASEKSDVVEAVVKAVYTPVLIGAGVHSIEDIKVAVKYGTAGVILSTDIVLAESPESELEKLAEAFK